MLVVFFIILRTTVKGHITAISKIIRRLPDMSRRLNLTRQDKVNCFALHTIQLEQAVLLFLGAYIQSHFESIVQILAVNNLQYNMF